MTSSREKLPRKTLPRSKRSKRLNRGIRKVEHKEKSLAESRCQIYKGLINLTCKFGDADRDPQLIIEIKIPDKDEDKDKLGKLLDAMKIFPSGIQKVGDDHLRCILSNNGRIEECIEELKTSPLINTMSDDVNPVFPVELKDFQSHVVRIKNKKRKNKEKSSPVKAKKEASYSDQGGSFAEKSSVSHSVKKVGKLKTSGDAASHYHKKNLTAITEIEAFGSELFRILLGKDRVGKSRAVYNEDGMRRGVVSREVENFVPLQTKFNALNKCNSMRYSEPITQFDNGLVNAGLGLLEVANMVFADPDAHFGNVGYSNGKLVRIDFDQVFFPETCGSLSLKPDQAIPFNSFEHVSAIEMFAVRQADLISLPHYSKRLLNGLGTMYLRADKKYNTGFFKGELKRISIDKKFNQDKWYAFLKYLLIGDDVYNNLLDQFIYSDKRKGKIFDFLSKRRDQFQRALIATPQFRDYVIKNPGVLDQIKNEFSEFGVGKKGDPNRKPLFDIEKIGSAYNEIFNQINEMTTPADRERLAQEKLEEEKQERERQERERQKKLKAEKREQEKLKKQEAARLEQKRQDKIKQSPEYIFFEKYKDNYKRDMPAGMFNSVEIMDDCTVGFVVKNRWVEGDIGQEIVQKFSDLNKTLKIEKKTGTFSELVIDMDDVDLFKNLVNENKVTSQTANKQHILQSYTAARVWEDVLEKLFSFPSDCRHDGINNMQAHAAAVQTDLKINEGKNLEIINNLIDIGDSRSSLVHRFKRNISQYNFFNSQPKHDAEVSLIYRALGQFDKNLRFNSSIKTFEELLIAQQKRDVIEELKKEIDRLWEENSMFEVSTDMKIDAYYTLIDTIKASSPKELVTTILSDNNLKILKQEKGKWRRRDGGNRVTVLEALNSDRGFGFVTSTSSKKIAELQKLPDPAKIINSLSNLTLGAGSNLSF